MPAIPEDVLRVAFNLPPEKAQAYLRKKGYAFSWNWHDVWQEAHAKAFTVAKAMRIDILESIRQMCQKAIDEGITFDKFQRSLEPYLKLAGWWGRDWPRDENGKALDENGNPWPIDDNGDPIIPADARPPQLGSPHRLRTIYEQNLQTALNAGRYKGMMDAAEARPWWQYVAVRDGATTQICSGLNGKVFRCDDPFWDAFYPPNHWRCRSRVVSLSDRELKRDGLVASSGEGRMGTDEVLLSKKTGETAAVATIKIGDRVFKATAGFSYNPGKAAFFPLIPRMSTASSIYESSPGQSDNPQKPSLSALPAKPVADYLLTDEETRGWSTEDYVNAFLRVFGAGIGNPKLYTNAAGEKVLISEAFFISRSTGDYKISRGRERYVKLLADTLADPAEVWRLWVDRNGQQRICDRYIGRYVGSSGKSTGGLVICDLIRDEWTGTTAFASTDLKYIDKQRSGILVYRKP